MDADSSVPNRSSSPLKRRASSMDSEADVAQNGDGSEGQTNGTFIRPMSIDPPECDQLADANEKAKNIPPLHEQIKIVETLLKASKESQVKEGDKAYLVSRTWFAKALALRSDKEDKVMEEQESHLGPIDNSDIIEEHIKDSSGLEFTRLKPGSGLESFELFPEDAWNMLVEWYGVKEGQQAIVRTAINDAPDPMSDANIIYELHPPLFKIHRLWSEVSPLPIEQALKAQNPPPLVLVRSRKARAHSFLKDVKNLSGVPLDRKIRLWSIPQQLPALDNPSQPTPPDSPGSKDESEAQDPWSHFLLDVPIFSQYQTQRLKVPIEDTTTNAKYNGKSSIQLCNLVTDQSLIVDEAVGNHFVSTFTRRDANSSALSNKSQARQRSPSPLGVVTRGRSSRNRPNKSLGAVGLHNLGNTCYMNSALQCIRSVEELTKYFLTKSHADELNKSNPLGYNGTVALVYNNLLNLIYKEGQGSVSPRAFKSTVGQCRSTFQGWGQQDSQEFIGFLLDALQEDLSRVKKKPYIEKPDSTDEMINDPEAIRKMAQEVWDITRKRDDSVIADLFTGMYKSTLKCPVCGKVSITFDPFNNLTLPLPVEDLMTRTIKFFPLNDIPVLMDVELKKHSSIESLKEFVSQRTGVPVDRLMGAEEFRGKFFQIYDNGLDVSEHIGQGDVATFHELEAVPTNWGSGVTAADGNNVRSMLDIDDPLAKAKWDDPRFERMVIPVFHRIKDRGDMDNVAPPHFVTLTREEASNLDHIRRKILEKVVTFSSNPALAEETDEESGSAASTTSNGDMKLAARSVDSEEDMVDITMSDSKEKPLAGPNLQNKILKIFNKKRPAFADHDAFLKPELQNLFNICYFSDDDNNSVPSGWQRLDAHAVLPQVSERIVVDIEPESWGSANSNSGNEETSNEMSNDEASTVDTSATRMVDESNDEDEDGASPVKRPVGVSKDGKKKIKTHAKRGTKRWQKEMKRMKEEKQEKQRFGSSKSQTKPKTRPKVQPTAPAVADGGPLVRIGEGLVIDWEPESWAFVFDEDSLSHFRTFDNLETLNDPLLKINQRRRHNRRARGITLDECLDEFERAEILSEQDMWYCPRCKEHRRASKKFDLWKSPDILVAHLKRFSSSGYRRDKLDVLVDFPIEGLDLTSRVIEKEDGREVIYDLIAVDDHYGGLGGGHYTAYAKNFMDGQWYSYNDSSVKAVGNPSEVVTSAAYLLFYRRRSDVPLGGPRFAEIFRRFDNGWDSDSCDSPVNFNSSSITARFNSDDEEPPSYNTIDNMSLHPSVEDEGIDVDDNLPGSKANPLTQMWSFDTNREDAMVSAFASDEVQADLSGDENGTLPEGRDQDIDMISRASEPFDVDTAWAWEKKDVHSVTAKTESGSDTDVVTEIHVDDDKDSQGSS